MQFFVFLLLFRGVNMKTQQTKPRKILEVKGNTLSENVGIVQTGFSKNFGVQI